MKPTVYLSRRVARDGIRCSETCVQLGKGKAVMNLNGDDPK